MVSLKLSFVLFDDHAYAEGSRQKQLGGGDGQRTEDFQTEGGLGGVEQGGKEQGGHFAVGEKEETDDR